MGEGFGELGLGAELTNWVERLGFARPTAVQREAIPVIRRGANVVLHAASGAGATSAYGLALLDRLHELSSVAGGLQALVVVGSEERARGVALELGRMGETVAVAVAVPAPGWQTTAARVMVVPVQRVLALLQSSQLKLDELQALVLHDVSAMLALDQQATLDTLVATVPREAQRVLVTSELTPATERLAEAHARKALHIPTRPAIPRETPAASEVTIDYLVQAGREARQAIAEAIESAGQPRVVYCRAESDYELLKQELSLRGHGADIRLYGTGTQPSGSVLGYGAPLDAESLRAAFTQDGLIALEASHLIHLRNIAKQCNIALRARPIRPSAESTGLDHFRATIRRALEDEDIGAQLLVIEPLLEEFSAAEIAAAASALLRKRSAVPAQASPRGTAAPSAPPPPAFVKLFLSAGQRDGIAPREIVGAITGEAGVKGDQIGRVEIRDTFSIVEVAAEIADRVIRSLNGTSLRGRSVRVDYDRKGGPTRRPPPPRRTHRQ